MQCHFTLCFAKAIALAVSFRPAGGASSLRSLLDLAQQPPLGKHGGLITPNNAAAQAGIKGALKGGWGLLTELAALHCQPTFQIVVNCWDLHTAVHSIGRSFTAELLGVIQSLDAVCRRSIQAPPCTTAEADRWGREHTHRCVRRHSTACMSVHPHRLSKCRTPCQSKECIPKRRSSSRLAAFVSFILCRCIPLSALTI